MSFKKLAFLYWIPVLVAVGSFNGHAMEPKESKKKKASKKSLYQTMPNEWDALCQAIENNDLEILSSLLDQNSEFWFLMDSDGNTLLHKAAICGNANAVDILLGKSGNVQAFVLRPNRCCETALHACVKACNEFDTTYHKAYIETIRKLLSEIKSAQARQILLSMPGTQHGTHGDTLLHYAVTRSYDVVKIILDSAKDPGALIFAKNKYGQTPLEWACQRLGVCNEYTRNRQLQCIRIVDLLMSYINQPDKNSGRIS